MSATANRIIRNTGFLYGKMAITILTGLFSTRIILEALGYEDFGIFNMIAGAVAMLGFFNSTLSSASQRFMSYAQKQGEFEQFRIFNTSVILHGGMAMVVALLLLISGIILFHSILNIPDERLSAAQWVYGIMAGSMLISMITVPYEAILNAHENMFFFSILGIADSILKLAIALLISLYHGERLVLYSFLFMGITLLNLIGASSYCHMKYRECRLRPIKEFHLQTLKSMGGFAGWTFLTVSSSMLSQAGMGIVLNHFFGPLLNAAQGIATQVSGTLTGFSANMLKALTPVIVKKEASGNRQDMLSFALIGCKYSYALLAFFAVPCIIEASYICKLWLGKVPEWSVLFVQLALVRSLSDQLSISISSAVEAQGDIKSFNIGKSILRLLPIIVTAIFFYYGMQAYWLYIIWILFGSLSCSAWHVFCAMKKCQLHLESYLRQVLAPSLLLSAGMALFSYMGVHCMEESLLRLMITFCLSSISFLVMIILLMSPREKQVFGNMFHIK